MSAWNEDNIKTLVKMWQAGHTASEISRELKVVSRSAILGKLNRMGMSGRARPSKPVKKTIHNVKVSTSRKTLKPSVPRSPRPTAPVRPAPPPISPVLMADGSFATILTITDYMCKWPIGDPSKDEFRFCGRKTDDAEEPYCKAHSSVAYQASRIRGSKTRALGPTPTSRKRIR